MSAPTQVYRAYICAAKKARWLWLSLD